MDNQQGTVDNNTSADVPITDEQIIDNALNTPMMQEVMASTAVETAVGDTPTTGGSGDWTPTSGGSGEAPSEEPSVPVSGTPTPITPNPAPISTPGTTSNNEVPDEVPRPTIPQESDTSGDPIDPLPPVQHTSAPGGGTPSTGGSDDWTPPTMGGGVGAPSTGGSGEWSPGTGAEHEEDDDEEVAHGPQGGNGGGTPTTGGSGTWQGGGMGHDSEDDDEDVAHTPTSGGSGDWQGGGGNGGGMGSRRRHGKRGRRMARGNSDDSSREGMNWTAGTGQQSERGNREGGASKGGRGAWGGGAMGGDSSNAMPQGNINLPGFATGENESGNGRRFGGNA